MMKTRMLFLVLLKNRSSRSRTCPESEQNLVRIPDLVVEANGPKEVGGMEVFEFPTMKVLPHSDRKIAEPKPKTRSKSKATDPMGIEPLKENLKSIESDIQFSPRRDSLLYDKDRLDYQFQCQNIHLECKEKLQDDIGSNDSDTRCWGSSLQISPVDSGTQTPVNRFATEQLIDPHTLSKALGIFILTSLCGNQFLSFRHSTRPSPS
jgi:hypothetical protein